MDPAYRFCGQPLSPAELELIVALVHRYPRLSRNELAHTVCEWLDWHRPNGGLKTAECRLLLEQLHERTLIGLPTLRQGRPRGAGTAVSQSCVSCPSWGTMNSGSRGMTRLCPGVTTTGVTTVCA